MIRNSIPHSFTQLKTALIAFANDLTLKVNQIHDNIPVYLQQSGDVSYVIREKFEETKTEDIILKTPRVVFNIDDMQFQQDQYTQQFNKYLYKFPNPVSKEEEVWQASGRRIPVNIIITMDFVCPNFIEYLQNFEVLSVIIAKDNVFTYEWGGHTFQSAWIMQSPSIERPSMDIGSSTRNWSIKATFDLQVHLLIPDINSFIRWKDTVIDDVKYTLREESNTQPKDLDVNIGEANASGLSPNQSSTLNVGTAPKIQYPGMIQNTPLFELEIEHSYAGQDFTHVGQYLSVKFGGTPDDWFNKLNDTPVGENLSISDTLTSKEIQTHIRALNALGARSYII